MKAIETLDELHSLYGTPAEPAIKKVTDWLTPSYRLWIERSRFCVVTTVGSGGTDGSPRGDEGPVVHILDDRTLALPDWRGNQRIDTLRNVVEDGRISLLFLIPGSKIAMRVNGTAIVTADSDLRQSFARDTLLPATVIVISIAEVYSQCARAIMRSGLWTSGDASADLPTVGQMLNDATKGEIDAAGYDAGWSTRVKTTMW